MPPAGTPCACCGRVDKLFCDHCHASGAFRGYICRTCNSGLGQLGDSVPGLERALAYLRSAAPILSLVDCKPMEAFRLETWHLADQGVSSKGQKSGR